jgi:hypothetical protein
MNENKSMTEEPVCVGVDIAKSTMDVAVSNSREALRFTNDDDGISRAVCYIADLNPAGIILEATGGLEMPLAAALQAACLPVAVINPRQVRDFARATGALAKIDTIDVTGHSKPATCGQTTQLLTTQVTVATIERTRSSQPIFGSDSRQHGVNLPAVC